MVQYLSCFKLELRVIVERVLGSIIGPQTGRQLTLYTQ